jgi:NAD-dependent dihydropyrimidine dehydrogenase PreA subunit
MKDHVADSTRSQRLVSRVAASSVVDDRQHGALCLEGKFWKSRTLNYWGTEELGRGCVVRFGSTCVGSGSMVRECPRGSCAIIIAVLGPQ